MTGGRLIAPLVLTAASLLILLCSPAQYLGRQHDDILYVIASQALSTGSYELFTSPGSPPLTQALPGFPFILQPIVWLFDGSTAAYQIYAAVILALCPWALWLWLKSSLRPHAAVLGALLFATSPLVLSQAGAVMSEGSYTLLSALLLMVLDRRRKAPSQTARSSRAGALLLLLIQVRPAGLSLLPGALARPLAEGRWKDAARSAVLPGLGLLLWLAWSILRSGEIQELREWSLTYRDQGSLHFLRLGLDNLNFFTTALGSCFLPDSWAKAEGASMAIGFLLAVLSLLGCLHALKKDRTEPAALMLAAGVIMHVFWGWQYERYLIPLLPLILWSLARALEGAGPWLLAALLAAQVSFHSDRWNKESSWSRPELTETYAWLKASTGPGDILASLLYLRDGFYTARPSVPLPEVADPENLARTLKKRKARVILWQERIDVGLSASATSVIQKMVDRAGVQLQDTRRFHLVYSHPGEGARVYIIRE